MILMKEGYLILLFLHFLLSSNCQGVYVFEGAQVNGSSSFGQCSSYTRLRENEHAINCHTPTSSVLFDGDIPILTGLDGDMWASPLLTLYKTSLNTAQLVFDFTNTPGYAGLGRVEMVIFNCPEWEIGVETIRLFGGTLASSSEYIGEAGPFEMPSSCYHLSFFCSTLPPRTVQLPLLTFEFNLFGYEWVHIAEMTFYGFTGRCPTGTVFPPPAAVTNMTSDTPSSVEPTTQATTGGPIHTTMGGPIHTTMGDPTHLPSTDHSLAVILGSSIPIICILASVAIVVFTASVIAICKRHSKFKISYDDQEQIWQEEDNGEMEEEEPVYEEIPDLDESSTRSRTHSENSCDRNSAAFINSQQQQLREKGSDDVDHVRVGDGETAIELIQHIPFVFQSNKAYGVELEGAHGHLWSSNEAYGVELEGAEHSPPVVHSNEAYGVELEGTEHSPLVVHSNEAYGVELEGAEHRSYENIMEDI